MKIQNPIIRGFYPDPSICKANGKYYIACSSFQYFPGVPIWESEDLVNWKQIGHCLTRKGQVELHQVPSSGGVFAPTLRYHDGTFYMVTNNNTFEKNFYIYTTDIKGEWSEPVFVDQEGIDPSLLFDDGKVYFTSNGSDANGNGCILQCEIDIKTGEKLTSSIPIWNGSGGRYLESPHLYHIGSWYYLMAAEGGTEYGHMITYARSRYPFGPFKGYAKNPVLTNRDQGGHLNTIQGIGHGDLIEDENGNWYIICLGFRQIGNWSPYHHLGREVFLAPVFWDEEGWFFAGDKGIVHEWMDVAIETQEPEKCKYNVSFETMNLENPRWCYMRDYNKENYRMDNQVLYLKGTEHTLEEADSPTFLGVHQSEFETTLHIEVSGDAKEAGVTFYMDENHHYELYLEQEKDGLSYIALRKKIGDIQLVINKVPVPLNAKKCVLEIESTAYEYFFYYRDGENRISLGDAKTKYLSSEVAGGFTGVLMGLYAVDEEERWAELRNLQWIQR